MQWLKERFSIFPKLVLTFLLVITPLFILSLYLIEEGRSSVVDELNRSLESRVMDYSDLLIEEIGRIMFLQQQYLLDKDLQRLSYQYPILSGYERSQALLRLQQKLVIIGNSSNYIEQAMAYIPSIGRYMSSGYYGLLPMNEFEALLQATMSGHEYPLFEWEDRLFLLLPLPAMPFESHDSKDVSFMLSIEMSIPKLREALSRFSDYKQAGAVIISEQGWSIAAYDAEKLVPDLAKLLEKAENNEAVQIANTVMADQSYMVAYTYAPSLGSTIVTYVAQNEVFGELDRYGKWIVLLSLISIFIILIFSYWIYLLIHRPLRQLVRFFRRVEKGNMEKIQNIQRADEFGYLYRQYNQMVDRLQVLIHEVYEQKLRVRSSEIKQLQSQINPHFLYNTYFILYRLAKIEDHESVMRFSRYLGEYFQFITRTNTDEVNLELEVKHTKTYAEIQDIRFSNRIKITFGELPQGTEEIKVPKLILQPVIENAFKHGLEDQLEGGLLHVEFSHEPEGLLNISVEDNGTEMTSNMIAHIQAGLDQLSAEGNEDGDGLRNVHRRLQLLYGDESGIRLSKSRLGGLKVELVMFYSLDARRSGDE